MAGIKSSINKASDIVNEYNNKINDVININDNISAVSWTNLTSSDEMYESTKKFLNITNQLCDNIEDTISKFNLIAKTFSNTDKSISVEAAEYIESVENK